MCRITCFAQAQMHQRRGFVSPSTHFLSRLSTIKSSRPSYCVKLLALSYDIHRGIYENPNFSDANPLVFLLQSVHIGVNIFLLCLTQLLGQGCSHLLKWLEEEVFYYSFKKQLTDQLRLIKLKDFQVTPRLHGMKKKGQFHILSIILFESTIIL